MKGNEGYHKPVLRDEAVNALQINPAKTYVDATFGGGGHASEVLKKLKDGKLIGFDQDADAQRNIPADDRFTLVNENFRYLKRFLRVEGAIPVSGILADLGVSSYQFDTAERGFSIRMNAPLDMRMDRRQEWTATDILREYSESKLWHLFEDYGEVRNARSLSAHLVKMRNQFPLETVGELKSVLTPLIKGNERRYLSQVFQALRIAVNDEMGALKELLSQAMEVLEPEGRLVVITFHSVEDRIVKQFMKNGKVEDVSLKGNEKQEKWRPVFKKPILPSRMEIKENSRAASAKMRVAEKIIG